MREDMERTLPSLAGVLPAPLLIVLGLLGGGVEAERAERGPSALRPDRGSDRALTLAS